MHPILGLKPAPQIMTWLQQEAALDRGMKRGQFQKITLSYIHPPLGKRLMLNLARTAMKLSC